jgi:glycosyltransferase involved in cell wall biosynthesis
MATPGGLTGAPRRLLTLAEVLRGRGVDVCIVSERGSDLMTAADTQGLHTAPLEAEGVLALRKGALFGGGALFRLRVALALLRHNWRFWQCIRERRADVVWVRASKGIAFAGLGALMSRRPLLWDVDYELPSRGLVRGLHRFGLWASKAVVLQYAAASEEIFGKALADRYQGKSHALIPGIDLERLEPHAEARRRLQRSRRNEPFLILQVGTICDRKNQKLTIDALRLAVERGLGEDWRLLLAYDEIQDLELQETVLKDGLEDNVEFLGWRDDINALMVRADLLLMPSKDEGVPNAVQEAMFIGLPVAASRAGGIPEIVDDNRTGWLLPLGEPAAWADRIVWCKDNPEDSRAVGRAASKFAADTFGTASWGRRYADVLCSAVVPARRRKV